MADRLTNLLGVLALVARDEQRAAETLSDSAASALVHLSAHGDQPLEQLRSVIGISQPATVRLVDSLAAAGLAERRPGADRRTLALRLTPAGHAAASAVLQRRDDALRRLLLPLGDEDRDALEAILARLVSTFASDRSAAVRVCRQCDRAACCGETADECPLQHTVP